MAQTKETYSPSEEAKINGNAFFSNCKYKDAIKQYTQAIILSQTLNDPLKLAIYHNNRASSYYILKKYKECLKDCDFSINFNPKFIKPYYRKALVLFSKQMYDDAKKIMEQGLSLCEVNNQNAEIKKLLEDIENRISQNQQERIDKMIDIKKQNSGNLADLKKTQMMRKLLFKEPEPVHFHEEYQNIYPEEKTHFEVLEILFYEIAMINITNQMIMTTEIDENQSYFLKRFGFIDPTILASAAENAQIGKVIYKLDTFKRQKPDYSLNHFFQSFNNSSPMANVLNYGKNYINIGFVDLSFVQNSTLKDFDDSKGEVNLYCYDACPFICAKTYIIVQMLSDITIPKESVFQVWYSSGWKRKTEQDFIRSSQEIIKKFGEFDEKIIAIIHSWISSPEISLQISRRKWFESMTPLTDDCYSFLNKKDRIEMARYLLTGELLEAEVGSRTMFIEPFENYKKIRGENFINSQNLLQINDNGKSFISSLVESIIHKISLMQHLIMSKSVKIYIKLAHISPKNNEILEEIKNLNPWVVSWSNLCDYFCKEDFIFMAKYISNEDTIHFGHTMNWIQQVWGTEVSDYPIESRKILAQQEQKAFGICKALYQNNVLTRVSSDFVTNIRNRMTFMLGNIYFKNWLDFYLEGTKNMISGFPFPSNLSENTHTFYFQFTFNRKINFNNN